MKKEKAEFFSNFQNSLHELNSIVDEMERGDLALERAMALFERAIKLLGQCHKAIEKAEQKVQILVAKDDISKLEQFQES